MPSSYLRSVVRCWKSYSISLVTPLCRLLSDWASNVLHSVSEKCVKLTVSLVCSSSVSVCSLVLALRPQLDTSLFVNHYDGEFFAERQVH